MAKLGDLIVRVGADTRGLNKSLGDVKKTMRQTTGNLTQMGKSLSMSLTAPLLGLGALAVKAASDFEFSMAKVQAVSGFTAAEMDKLEAQAQELGATTSRSASDVAELQLELAKLGKTSTEIEQMTEGVLSLSIAFDQELGETARVVGATLNQFGLDASESGRIADNMATLFGSSALDLEKFDTAMRTVGPTANAMGLSVEEAGAALGILVNAGVDASTAGTALTKSLTTLAKEGMTGAEAIEFLTTNNLSVADAFEKFGDRAGKIIPILKGTTGAFQDLTQKQIEGTGAALEARKILEDTAMGGFDRLRSSVEALGISMGEALLPIVKKMADSIASFASKLASMSDGTKTAVVVVAGLAAAIGPLLIILPNLVNGLKLARIAMLAMNASMLANPFGAVAMAIGLVVGGLIALNSAATDGASKTDQLKESLGGLSLDEQASQIAGATAAQKAFVEQIESEKKAIEELAPYKRSTNSQAGRDLKKLTAQLEEANKELKAMQALEEGVTLKLESLGETADEVAGDDSNGVNGLASAASNANKEIAKTTETLGMLMTTLENTQVEPIAFEMSGVDQLLSSLTNVEVAVNQPLRETKSIMDSLVSISDSVGAAFGSAFASIITGAKSGKEAIVEMTKTIIMAALAGSQAAIIEAMINSGKFTGPAAPFVIPALIATGIAMVGGAFEAIPAFADGGIVSGPTLGLVGEYPGASTNPEVIAPLDKLRSMMGGQNVVVTGKISGRDILLTSERNAIDRNRVRGF
jgi:phage-related minor tail protein